MSVLFSFNTLIILGIVVSAVLAVVFEKPLSSVIIGAPEGLALVTMSGPQASARRKRA